MTKELTTQVSTLEARNENLPTVSAPFVIDGMDLMPPDDGSLARRVYDSAADKNNPPLELLAQYLFKKGYRRIQEVSDIVKLNAEQRYDEIVAMICPPSKSSEYFTQVEEDLHIALYESFAHAFKTGLPWVQEPVRHYITSLGLGAMITSQGGIGLRADMPHTKEVVREGLHLRRIAHPSIQSLDLFVRTEGQSMDAFAFVERAQPKGLSMIYAHPDPSSLPTIIRDLLKGGTLTGRSGLVDVVKHPYPGELKACIHRRHSAGPLVLAITGSAMIGTALATGLVPLAVLGLTGMAGGAYKFLYGTHEPDSKAGRLLEIVDNSAPFPNLTEQARQNYEAIYQLEAADNQVLMLPK